MKPRFSIIIPTLNEAAELAGTLASVRAAFGADAECIVSDGGSADGTCDIARAAGALVVEGETGRGQQLNAGFQSAHGDICVFLHADTRVPAGASAAVSRAIEQRGAVAGAFSLDFGAVPFLLRSWQGAINARSRILRIATGDQAIFARKSVLQTLGGVPLVPLFEDVRLCSALKRCGRFEILPERVMTSPRLWLQLGLVRGILLHLSLRLLHALGAPPSMLVRYYPLPRL